MSNETFKVTYNWSLSNGSIGQNIVYVRCPGSDAYAPAVFGPALGAHMEGKVTTWLAIMCDTSSLADIEIREFDVATNTVVPYFVHPVGTVGTQPPPSMACGVAMKINLLPPQRSRAAGIYLPAPAFNYIATGAWASATATAAAVAVGVGLTSLTLIVSLGVYVNPEYYSSKDLAMVALDTASVVVDDIYDYIRSRKRGVGI